VWQVPSSVHFLKLSCFPLGNQESTKPTVATESQKLEEAQNSHPQDLGVLGRRTASHRILEPQHLKHLRIQKHSLRNPTSSRGLKLETTLQPWEADMQPTFCRTTGEEQAWGRVQRLGQWSRNSPLHSNHLHLQLGPLRLQGFPASWEEAVCGDALV
jgi:hypothetical protein